MTSQAREGTASWRHIVTFIVLFPLVVIAVAWEWFEKNVVREEHPNAGSAGHG